MRKGMLSELKYKNFFRVFTPFYICTLKKKIF